MQALVDQLMGLIPPYDGQAAVIRRADLAAAKLDPSQPVILWAGTSVRPRKPFLSPPMPTF